MKNLQDVLREKQTEIERLTQEIEMLRTAARILESQSPPARSSDPIQRHVEVASVKVDDPVLDVLPAPGPASRDRDKRWPN